MSVRIIRDFVLKLQGLEPMRLPDPRLADPLLEILSFRLRKARAFRLAAHQGALPLP